MALSRERVAVIIATIPPIVLILGAPAVLWIVEPFVLGMPFNLFWHLMWMIVGPLLLTVAYLIRVKEMERA